MAFCYRFHDFGNCTCSVRLPAGVRGSDGDGAGAGAGRHGAGGHGQHAGLPPPPLQVQGDAVRLGRTHLLRLRQRHVLLGPLRLQRGLFKIHFTSLNFLNAKLFSPHYGDSINLFWLLSQIDWWPQCQFHSLLYGDKQIAIHLPNLFNRNIPPQRSTKVYFACVYYIIISCAICILLNSVQK